MLAFRDVELLPVKTVGNAGTETIDVNVTDPITEMGVYFKVTNYTSGAAEYPPHRMISKIEIVDGGTVYYSLDGHMALAASAHDCGKFPTGWWDDGISVGQYIRLPLRFGRYLGDEEYAFSPTRLLNPQIKITWAINTTYHTTAVSQLGVVLRLMEGASLASKMLAWKEIRSFTTVGAGEELTDMPRDLPWRQLMVRSAYLGTTYQHESSISNYKLDCDGGKFIPFDLGTLILKDLMRNQVPIFERHGKWYVAHGDMRQTWMGDNPFTLGAGLSDCYSWGFHNNGSPRVQVWGRKLDGSDVSDTQMFYQIHGWMPSQALLYRFGRLNDAGSWFNAPQYGDIRLWMKQAKAGATATIAVQQPRQLP